MYDGFSYQISRDAGCYNIHKFVIIFGHINVVSLFKSYLWEAQGPSSIQKDGATLVV